jgi:hypothetical protein
MHRRRLAGHDFVVCDYSRVRNFNPIERLVYAAAVHDPATALHFHAFGESAHRRVALPGPSRGRLGSSLLGGAG